MQIATHLVSFNNNRQQTVVVKGSCTQVERNLSERCMHVTRLIGFLIIGVGQTI